jgi:hypothetical protein
MQCHLFPCAPDVFDVVGRERPQRREETKQSSAVIPILRSRLLSSSLYRGDPNYPAHRRFLPSAQPWARRSQIPTSQRFSPYNCALPTHPNAAIPPLSCSQLIQSSKAAGSLVSQMARRRHDESRRETWCECFETRKQKEHGGGGHMSACARDRRR